MVMVVASDANDADEEGYFFVMIIGDDGDIVTMMVVMMVMKITCSNDGVIVDD